MAAVQHRHALSRRDFLKLSGALIAAGVLTPGCESLGLGEPEERAVTFQFNWFPGDEHAPYYVAQERGFFADEGLAVDLRPGRGSSNTVTLVGSGDANLGVASADAVAVATGAEVPILSVAAVLQEFPYVIAVREDSDIRSPQDFAGQRVLLFTDDVLFERVILPAIDLSPDDVVIRTIGEEVPLAPMLLEGEIDIIPVFYYNQGIAIEAEGVPLRYFFLNDMGIDLYGHAILTSQSFHEENSDVVQRFLNAAVRGWVFTLQNAEEAVDILLENVDGLERDMSLAAWQRIKELAVNEDTEENGFGWQTEARWQATLDTFASAGVIQSEPDAANIFTNEYLEEIPDRSV